MSKDMGLLVQFKMKILYGASNRPGSNIQLKRFLDNCSEHEIRYAAYLKNSEYLNHIDWTLDALKSRNSFDKKHTNALFGYKSAPYVDYYNAAILLEEVEAWKPDLVISDVEKITAHIAKALDLPLWYCSPLLLFIGAEWEQKQIKYHSVIWNAFYSLPEADVNLVYSPFCDVSMRPLLKSGYEWCKPYHEPFNMFTTDNARIKNDSFRYVLEHLPKEHALTTGETSFLADAIYSEKFVHVAPNMSDPESLLNATLCETHFIGSDLGEIETSLDYTINHFENILTRSFSPYLSRQNWPYLHERILCNQ